MVSSEFEGMKLLFTVIPEMVAEPIAWGRYKAEPDAYFFVCRFHELSGTPPSASSDFPALVAALHGRRVAKEFGLPLTTYGGRNPMHFPVSASWEACFSGGLAAWRRSSTGRGRRTAPTRR